jgi:hypothetical protein
MKPVPTLHENIRSVVGSLVEGITRDQVRSFVEEGLVEFFRTDHAGRAKLALGLQDVGHGVPVSDLSPDGSRRFRRALLLRREFTPAVIDALADRARQGDEDAGWVLQEHAERLRAQDQRVPEALVSFLNEKRPRKRGRKSGDCEVRNMKILAARDLLVEQCGYHATRNRTRETSDESACDVLARVLGRAGENISARGVEKICERRGRKGGGTRRKKAPQLYNIIGIKIDGPSDL